MNFKTHNDNVKISVNGSSLQGYIDLAYNDICKVFGKPTESDGYKSDAEWIIKFDNDAVATIYNYKDGKNYLGEEGLAVEDIRDWHIGGFNKEAVALVKETLLVNLIKQIAETI